MKKEEHKLKLVFNSKVNGLTTIEEEFRNERNETNVIKNVNTSLGVSSFPIAEIKLNATSKYPNLISTKSGDEVTVYGGLKLIQTSSKCFKAW